MIKRNLKSAAAAAPVLLALWLCLLAAPLRAAPAPSPVPAPAAPANPDADAGKHALSLYNQGNTQFNLGHYEEALALFEKAYQTKPVVGLLYNAAQCHRLLGNLEQARRVYRSYINQTTDVKTRALAQEKLAEVESVLEASAKSRLSAPTSLAPVDKSSQSGTPAEAEAAVKEGASGKSDGKPEPKLEGARLASTSGAAPGKPEEQPKSEVKPPAPDAALGSGPAAPARASNHITFWAALGAGVLTAGGGVFFGLQAKSAHDALAAGNLDRPTADSKAATLASDAKLGNLLLIGGAVLLAGAAAAFVFDAP